ncbi:MAG TPA: dethiobiotin synthase [Stellaceae bacterium]|jgi:dethiobiotin synthetase|nr:dethiobiotin synthase [Stellaceae bacterium]
MSAVFVTGTGTDIGKTFVTAALIHELRRRSRNVDALKPVASGFDPAHVGDSDPGALLAALDEPATQAALDRIAPWRFRAPLSPDMAARHENRAIDFAALVAHSRAAIAAAPGVLLIEGVGGIMVPLDERHTVLDWMAALNLPLILVAGSYLGAISHALSALEVLRTRGLAVTALVVNETPASTVALDETAATIARFAAGVPVIALPRIADAAQPHPAIGRLTDLLDRF